MAKINIERYFEENNGMLFPAEFTIVLDSSDQVLMDEISGDYNLLSVEPGQDKIIVSLPSKRSMIEGAADQINDLIDRIRLSWANAGEDISSVDNNNSDDGFPEFPEAYQLINEYSGSVSVSKFEPDDSSLRDHLRFKSSFRVGAEISGDEISDDSLSARDKLNFPVLIKSDPLSSDVNDSAIAERSEVLGPHSSAESENKPLLPDAAEEFGSDEYSGVSESDDILDIDVLTGISGFDESGDLPVFSDDIMADTDESVSDAEDLFQNSGLVLPDLPPDASDFLSSGTSDPLDPSLLSEFSFNPEEIPDDTELILDDSLSPVIPEDAFSGEFPDEFSEEVAFEIQDDFSGLSPDIDEFPDVSGISEPEIRSDGLGSSADSSAGELSADFSDLNLTLGDELLSESDLEDMGAEDDLLHDNYFSQKSDDADRFVLPDLPDDSSEILSSEMSDSEIISGLIPDIGELDDLSESIDFEGLDELGDLEDIGAGSADSGAGVSELPVDSADLDEFESFEGLDELGDLEDMGAGSADSGAGVSELPVDSADLDEFESFEGLDELGDLEDIGAGPADSGAGVSDVPVDSADLDEFESFEGLDELGDLEDIGAGPADSGAGVSELPVDSADFDGFESFEGLDELGDLEDIGAGPADSGAGVSELPVDSADLDEFESFEGLDELGDLEDIGAGPADSGAGVSEAPADSADFDGFEGLEESGDENVLSALPASTVTDKSTDEAVLGDKEEYFRNITERDPSDASGWSGLGNVLAEKGMTEEAEYAFTQSVNLDFSNEDALMGLFYIFKGKGCYSEAVEFINVLIRKKPWDSSLLYEKAVVEETAGNNSVAERELKKAVILDPDNTLAWAKLALLLVKKGRNEEALECYSELTKLKPGVSEVWYSKGLVLKSLQRNDEALSAFEKCLDINPGDNDALKEKAAILLAEGDYSRAVVEYENAVKSDPKSLWALSGLASSYEMSGHNDKALNVYDKILEINPAEISALESKAELLLKSHLFAEAKNAYIKISSLEPDNPDIWLTIAKLSENSGQFDESMEAYNRALELDPVNQDGLRGRIRVLVSQGRYEESIPDYNFLIIQNPSDASLIADKAIACIRTGKPDEAIVLYNSALNLDKSNSKILMELIDLLTSLGRLEETLPVYDRLISLMPEETDLLLSKGLILAGVKRHREAVSCFNRVLAKKRGDPEVMLNLGISLLCLGEKEKALKCYKLSLEADPEFGNRWLESGISAASFLMAKEKDFISSPKSYGPRRDVVSGKMESETKPVLSSGSYDYPYGLSREDLDKYGKELADDDIQSERSATKDQSKRFEEERKRDPNELVRKGIELTKSGFYDVAEKSLLQALDIDDYNEPGYFSLGVLYGKTERYTEAIDCFEKVLMINPSNKKAGRGIIMARNKI